MRSHRVSGTLYPATYLLHPSPSAISFNNPNLRLNNPRICGTITTLPTNDPAHPSGIENLNSSSSKVPPSTAVNLWSC